MVWLCCTLGGETAMAQINPGRILKNTQKKTEKKIEKRIEKRIDNKVDQTLDKIEGAIEGKEKQEEVNATKPADKSNDEVVKNSNETVESQQEAQLNWARFDFIPGDIIIFEDNLEGERNGEFPGKWDLTTGTVENAVFNGENVIMFIRTNINSDGGIVPLMTNSNEDYLPDEFTIEFDAYFHGPRSSYRILFYDGKNQRQLNRGVNPGSGNRDDRVIINQNSGSYMNTVGHYPGFGRSSTEDAARSKPGWRRISVSFNKRALKAYIDDSRVLNIPNMNYNPIGLTFAYHNPNGDHTGYIKNVRVAKGAVPLYDKFLTDGKIVTNGIRFDVNKATIKPESFGVINEIVKLMNDHPNLRFSVEGHTDSDGGAELNMRLSEARAKAVVDKMTELGIAPARLSFKGYGQTSPIAPNNTAEGKAQNRRVEFVKL